MLKKKETEASHEQTQGKINPLEQDNLPAQIPVVMQNA